MKEFECRECDHHVKVDGEERPECCGKPMVEVPLGQCTMAPSSPEHARSFDDDEPCDDGRAG